MRTRNWLGVALAFAVASGVVVAPAQAEQDRAIMLIVGGGVSHDSNFFRVPNDVARSERITTASVGLSIDKVYSQQEVRLLVTKAFQRYENFSYLNFNPLNADFAWRWRVTPRVSGSLTYARTQALNNFEDTRDFTQRNIRTSQSAAFDMDAQVSGAGMRCCLFL